MKLGSLSNAYKAKKKKRRQGNRFIPLQGDHQNPLDGLSKQNVLGAISCEASLWSLQHTLHGVHNSRWRCPEMFCNHNAVLVNTPFLSHRNIPYLCNQTAPDKILIVFADIPFESAITMASNDEKICAHLLHCIAQCISRISFYNLLLHFRLQNAMTRTPSTLYAFLSSIFLKLILHCNDRIPYFMFFSLDSITVT